MSFYTSLSGLKGAQSELATVSNNIANVGSYGFKKSRTEFGDIVSSSKTTAGQGTRLKGIEQQFSQGGVEATSDDLDLLISGAGFFITRDALAGGSTAFTRNGSFGLSSPENYLVDSSGAYVQAYPVDPQGNALATGLVAATSLEIPRTIGISRATSEIDLSANLPTGADIPANRPVYTATNPYAFSRTDPNSYNYAIQTTVYDSAGKTFPATVYMVRLTDGATDNWEARVYVGAENATPVPLAMTFDATGTMTVPAPPGRVGLTAVQPAGAESPLTLTLDLGTTNQASNRYGATIEQDGIAAGKLNNVSVGDDGLVTATFSNGQTQPVGKLAIANFSNPAGLKQLGDARWSVTGDSGTITVGEAGTDGLGRVQSGALERANVDITEELVALISAQRNFQANAKAIETAGTMTQAIINMRT